MTIPRVEELRARSLAVWNTGDYEPTSRQLEPASEWLVEALGVGPGQVVLDVAAGHGNCALAAARRGARVVATDFASSMVEAGRRRTEGRGIGITWQEADAADLPFDEATFDRVTSVFGAIFAPDQTAAAAEAVRVARPGGGVGLTAWTPDGYTSRLLHIARRYSPPVPSGAPDPLDWGRPEHVAELFEPTGSSVDIRRRSLTFRYPSWEAWRASMEAHGMGVLAKQTLPAARYEAMFEEIRALTEESSYGEDGAVAFDSDYLEILVTKG